MLLRYGCLGPEEELADGGVLPRSRTAEGVYIDDHFTVAVFLSALRSCGLCLLMGYVLLRALCSCGLLGQVQVRYNGSAQLDWCVPQPGVGGEGVHNLKWAHQ